MSFSSRVVQKVWEKGAVVAGANSAEWRKDACGAWICREYYGKTDNIYGWNIDHTVPRLKGGSDELSNLRPLQCDNNRAKAAGRTDCVVTSQGNQNIKK